MFSLLFGAILQLFVEANVLSAHEMSLGNRYTDANVNEVMKKNILLTIGYMRGLEPDWEIVTQPFSWVFTLLPGQTVSYHNVVLPKYQNARPLTNVHFSQSEGFLSDGWLVGDGICHLASLLSWAARDAGLFVEAPTNHDFRAIAEIPKEQGVSIYSDPKQKARSDRQNLYIQNTLANPVEFVFTYDGDVLEISVRAARTM